MVGYDVQLMFGWSSNMGDCECDAGLRRVGNDNKIVDVESKV